MSDNCELCAGPAGTLLWKHELLRVVLVDDPSYPGFCRVIWTEHTKEMTDLTPARRAFLMAAVFGVEQAIREVLNPDKVNLASLGNMVPHLHWHVIPRRIGDKNFPNTIWGKTENEGQPDPLTKDQISKLKKAIEKYCSVLKH